MTTNAKTTVKYIVHFYGYYGLKRSKQTYRKLDSAVECLNCTRENFRDRFAEHDFYYSDYSQQITFDDVNEMINDWFYIEKQVVTSEIMDY